MDLTKLIEEKINRLPRAFNSGGINSALRHIQVAEEHFERAVANQMRHLFNDVIYRTNLAFEAGLREAYQALSNTMAGRETKAWKIEKYFESNAVFNERVQHLFNNYREKWRNESAHDYQIEFTEEEALLGISSVSAFVSILVDQIKQAISEREIKLAENRELETKSSSSISSEAKDPVLQIGEALKICANKLRKDSNYTAGTRDENSIIGFLAGFLEAAIPGLKAKGQERYKDAAGSMVSPDLVLIWQDKKFPVEIKLAIESEVRFREAVFQVLSLQRVLNSKAGFVFSIPANEATFEKLEINSIGESSAVGVIR